MRGQKWFWLAIPTVAGGFVLALWAMGVSLPSIPWPQTAVGPGRGDQGQESAVPWKGGEQDKGLVRLECPDPVVVSNEGVSAFRIRVVRNGFQGEVHVSVRIDPDAVARLPAIDAPERGAKKLWLEVSRLRALASGGSGAFGTRLGPEQSEACFGGVPFAPGPSAGAFPYLRQGSLTAPVVATASGEGEAGVVGWGQIRVELNWGP